MNSQEFITQIASGNATEAQETLKTMLSNAAFEALEVQKQSVAKNLFGGAVVEEEAEQIDELRRSDKEVIKNAKAKSSVFDWRKKPADADADSRKTVVKPGVTRVSAKNVDESTEDSGKKKIDEASLISGKRLIATYHSPSKRFKAEVRHDPEWDDNQVHFYKDGKHMGEGPVSYHGSDREDAHNSAKAGLEHFEKNADK